jgi:amidase
MKELLVLTTLLGTVNSSVNQEVTTTTISTVDLTEMNIYEIQEAVDDGYLTYEQIMNIYLERIEEYNDDNNAVLYINEQAIEEAKKADQEYKEKGRSSLIFGLPILVKDNIDVKGMPTTGGTKGLKDNYPKANAPAVQNIIDAGGIVRRKRGVSKAVLLCV